MGSEAGLTRGKKQSESDLHLIDDTPKLLPVKDSAARKKISWDL